MKRTTSIYRALILEIERRRAALEFPMEKFSEFAGLPDRYYSKSLNPDSPNGRQAQWRTVQIMVDALFPNGFDLVLRPVAGEVFSSENLKAKLLQLKALKDPKSQRELMSELGKRGGSRSGVVRRSKSHGKKMRRARARKAALARWRNGLTAKEAVL